MADALAAVMPGSPVKHRTHIVVGDISLAWLYGYAYEQAMPEDYDERYAKWNAADLPIVPNEWVLKPKDSSTAQLKAIAALHKKADRVVHAGDPDAEGQLLVQEVLDELKNRKPVFRVLVNDYNEQKVRESIRAMRPNTDAQFVGWHAWAECRGRLDYLFGINLTRAYTLRGRALGFDGVLSVGRVQTPTLAIVVNRDETIEKFKAIPFFKLKAQFRHDAATFVANWRPREAQAGLDIEGRLTDATVAQQLVTKLRGRSGTVVTFADTARLQVPPLPFDLTALQMAANDRYGYTAAQVLEAAQALYDKHKVTTYPRTDDRYLSVAQHAESAGRLDAASASAPHLADAIAKANRTLRSPAFNDSKATAHHGIVPTAKVFAWSSLSEREQNIYDLIARAFVAQFYPPYGFREREVTIDLVGESFSATGKVPTALGWKAVYNVIDDEQASDESAPDNSPQKIPALSNGLTVPCDHIAADAAKTTPPKRFTEKLLLAAMENIAPYVTNSIAKARLKESKGIGTPATRANILEELKKRGFLDTKGKQLISTASARALVHALPTLATDPGFTGMTEQTLDQVAAGKVTSRDFLTRTAELVRTLTAQAATATMNLPIAPKIACPKCREGELKLRKRKDATGKFWACSRYNDGCAAIYDDKRGRPDFAPKATRKSTKPKAATKKPAAKKASTTRSKGIER